MKPLFSYHSELDGSRLDIFLAHESKKSRAFVQEQIEKGYVLVNSQAVRKQNYRLKKGDTVSGHWEERPGPTLTPIAAPLSILYEDGHLLVIYKPQGVVVHPAPGHRGETLIHYLLHHLQNAPDFLATSPTRPGLVHRLDRGTSGVLVIAKNLEVQGKLQEQFQLRTVNKIYEAIVWGNPGVSGTFRSQMGRDRRDRKRMSRNTQKGKDAVTSWKTLHSTKHFSHVELAPKTGRTHQLRVHLTEHQTPIVGDDLYGTASAKRRLPAAPEKIQTALATIRYPFLHARSLEFTHPVSGERMTITATRPEVFEHFLLLIQEIDR